MDHYTVLQKENVDDSVWAWGISEVLALIEIGGVCRITWSTGVAYEDMANDIILYPGTWSCNIF